MTANGQKTTGRGAAPPAPPEAKAFSPAAARLLSAAAAVEAGGGETRDEELGAFAEFVRIYRDWITFHRGLSGSPARRREQRRLLLHAMLSAETLREALEIQIRFHGLLWGKRGLVELRDEGGEMALVFAEPIGPAPEDLITALWPLSLTLCELEFLASGRLQSARGRIPAQDRLPAGAAALLFDRPLAFGGVDLALILSKRELDRVVLARTADLPNFLQQLLPAALGARGQATSMRAVVASLIRNEKQRDPAAGADLATLAKHLGCSAVTVRRRLRDEGASYREIKDEVVDGLAKTWLRDRNWTVEEIAQRLGFSDAFAFRRAFRRRNGRSPQAFRRELTQVAG